MDSRAAWASKQNVISKIHSHTRVCTYTLHKTSHMPISMCINLEMLTLSPTHYLYTSKQWQTSWQCPWTQYVHSKEYDDQRGRLRSLSKKNVKDSPEASQQPKVYAHLSRHRQLYPSRLRSVLWYMPIIPELERLRQEDCLEFKDSLNYTVKPCIKNSWRQRHKGSVSRRPAWST